MATLDDLHTQLRVVAALLDTAAAQIRELSLAPRKENVGHIADALTSVFEVMRAVHAIRPDLVPSALPEPSFVSEANKRLTHALGEALRLVDEGRPQPAFELLSSYAASEPEALHRRIALHELARLKGEADT